MSDRIFSQTILKLIDSLTTAENYDSLIQILALLCVFSIANRPMDTKQPTLINPTSESPLQKLLGDFSKGNPPDMLSTLLPLLANPQLKTKLNPSNLSSVIGMINNLANGFKQPPTKPADSSTPQKSEPEIKTTVQTAKAAENIACKPQIPSEKSPSEKQTNTSSPDTALPVSLPAAPESPSVKPASTNRHLNWKTNF